MSFAELIFAIWGEIRNNNNNVF